MKHSIGFHLSKAYILSTEYAMTASLLKRDPVSSQQHTESKGRKLIPQKKKIIADYNNKDSAYPFRKAPTGKIQTSSLWYTFHAIVTKHMCLPIKNTLMNFLNLNIWQILLQK